MKKLSGSKHLYPNYILYKYVVRRSSKLVNCKILLMMYNYYFVYVLRTNREIVIIRIGTR